MSLVFLAVGGLVGSLGLMIAVYCAAVIIGGWLVLRLVLGLFRLAGGIVVVGVRCVFFVG